MLEILIIALGLIQSAVGLQANLLHRVFVPSSPESAQFIPKGSVDLDYVPGTSFTDLNSAHDTDMAYPNRLGNSDDIYAICICHERLDELS
jgi:hypothetical protein